MGRWGNLPPLLHQDHAWSVAISAAWQIALHLAALRRYDRAALRMGLMTMRLPYWIILLGLAGCAPFPTLDARLPAADRSAPYPDLVPLAPLLAQNGSTARITPQSVTSFEARAALLRARANGLRAPVVDPATRVRMQRGVTPLALR